MGPKHPISRKLKKYNIWNSILYKFYSVPFRNGNILSVLKGERKNIIKSINHYFQNLIISKPLLYFENNVLNIKIFYFIKPSINQKLTASNSYIKKQPPWNHKQITKLERILEKFYGNKVKLQLIKLNNPIFNANILAQLIAINLKSHGIGKIWRILLRKIKTSSIESKKLTSFLNKNVNWMSILNKGIFCKEFYSHITGLKLKLSGRISKRRGASRTNTINRSIGTLQLNSIDSSIDYGHIEKKDKNGSQSIKIYIANYITF